MSTLTYKCPSCGAPLTFEGARQEMTCGSCDNSFSLETVREVARIEQEDAGFERMEWDMHDENLTAEEAARTRAYSCSSCGSELVTDETTVATNCAFCGSPSILPAQFTLDTRPETIVPFIITKAQAEKMFADYFKGKRLLPNLFQRDNRIDEIRQLYVPYWLFDCQADANITYNATQVRTSRSGQYEVTRTRHFLVHRAGTLAFRKLPVDASSKLHNDITESIEPFDQEQAIGFSPETLSGALANRADVPAEECVQRANDRVKRSTEDAFRNTVQGYTSVSPRNTSIRIDNGVTTPTLLPIWLIMTKKGGKTYTFAINGQTGELTCDIPYSKPKFFKYLFGLTALIGGGGYLLLLALAFMGVIS